MKKTCLSCLLALVLAISSTACYTLNHTVGDGAQGTTEVSKRQWWAVWGLVPIGEVDSYDLAKGAKDYSVETQWTIIDILLNLITGWVTIFSQTVTVTK